VIFVSKYVSSPPIVQRLFPTWETGGKLPKLGNVTFCSG